MSDQEHALSAEILADAQKRAQRIGQRAQGEAQKLAAAARQEAAAIREQALQQAQGRAARQREVNRAHIAQEVSGLRMTRQQDMVDRVRAAVERRLAQVAAAPEHRQVLKCLALLAIGTMSGDRFELVLRTQDRQRWGQELAQEARLAVKEELGRDVQIEVAADSLDASGGLMVRGAGGHEVADQTFEARLHRLWDEVRAPVGAMLPEMPEET